MCARRVLSRGTGSVTRLYVCSLRCEGGSLSCTRGSLAWACALFTFFRQRAFSIGRALHQVDPPTHIAVVADACTEHERSVKRLHVCSLRCGGGSLLEVRERPSGVSAHTAHVFQATRSLRSGVHCIKSTPRLSPLVPAPNMSATWLGMLCACRHGAARCLARAHVDFFETDAVGSL